MFRDDPEHHRRHSDAGFSIVWERVRLRQEKPVRSEAEEERQERRKGWGERGGSPAAALVPAQRWRDPERDQRSEPQLTGLINTTQLIVIYRL